MVGRLWNQLNLEITLEWRTRVVSNGNASPVDCGEWVAASARSNDTLAVRPVFPMLEKSQLALVQSRFKLRTVNSDMSTEILPPAIMVLDLLGR